MSVSSSHPQPRLADHVRACHVGDQMILLDLLRDRYIGIGGPQLPALSAAILSGLPINDAQADPSNQALVNEWIRRLRHQQLLSDAPAAEPVPSPGLLEPTAGLGVDAELDAVGSEWRHLVRLWRATLITTAWLRGRNLADISDRVVALRARHSARDPASVADALHAAARSYMRLRPFALTTHDRCLYDSLALIHFLATQGLFAKWVIGVRVHPFGAHSWVQKGSVVLNDLPERVRRYQPILVV